MVILKLASIISVLGIAFASYMLIDSVSYIYAQQNNTEILNPESSAISLRQLNWTNNNKERISLAIETNIKDSTNVTLLADVKQASSLEQATNSSWSVISTDFIPIKNTAYNFSLGVSARDVNQLHSKVYYYDSNKTEISSDFVFGGKDGTFEGNFSKAVSPPPEAKFFKLQMWIRQTLGKDATYSLHNIDISKIVTNMTTSNQTTDARMPFIVKSENGLEVERIFSGVNDSTSMAFLGPNDILILERGTGKVIRILDGKIQGTLIDLDSVYKDGLLGIATSKNQDGSLYVFLFYNEAPSEYNSDIENLVEAAEVNNTLGYNRLGDRLVRYELVEDKLINPKLLFELKSPVPGKNLEEEHHGGELILGPDGALYVVIGDLDGWKYDVKTKAQNYKDGKEPDGRSGILRITQDGKVPNNGIIGNTYPLNLYYAYGIRNSFGMDFDPVTGNLWDTENGPDYGDEINLVKPGFNSGSDIVQGFSTESNLLDSLEDFGGKGSYSDPEFVWTIPVAPTAIKFFNSKGYGPEYENDMFVADVNNGNIYHFDLNQNRTELALNGPLKDKVADKPSELDGITFARGFGGITDMQIGPDGYMYVLTLEDYTNEKYAGSVYRINPKS